MFLFLLLSAGAGIGIAGGVTGGAASISEKVVNSKQMKVAKEALISDQESTLELQSQIEALRYHPYITSAFGLCGWFQKMASLCTRSVLYFC